MVDTQNTLFVFQPNHQNLALQPLTPFSAVTPQRATASRPRRLISATTLEMILEEETAPEEDRLLISWTSRNKSRFCLTEAASAWTMVFFLVIVKLAMSDVINGFMLCFQKLRHVFFLFFYSNFHRIIILWKSNLEIYIHIFCYCCWIKNLLSYPDSKDLFIDYTGWMFGYACYSEREKKIGNVFVMIILLSQNLYFIWYGNAQYIIDWDVNDIKSKWKGNVNTNENSVISNTNNYFALWTIINF